MVTKEDTWWKDVKDGIAPLTTPEGDKYLDINSEGIELTDSPHYTADMIKNPGKYYVWRTQQDDKVRSGHAARDGRIFKFENGNDPGNEYNCRCYAEPLDIKATREDDFIQGLKVPGKEFIGYEDNPNKIDQPTHTGIINDTLQSFHKKFPKLAVGYPNHVRDLTQDQIDLIYKKIFIEPYRINEIKNNRVAQAVFDMHVMSSPRPVANTIQDSLNRFGISVENDGILGSETIKGLNSIKNEDIEDFMSILKNERMKYLDTREDRNKYPGWITRTMNY